MSVFKTLQQYWDHDVKKETLMDQEKKIVKKYNIIDTYLSNELNIGYLFEYVGTVNNSNINIVYNKNNINLIFPEYGTRICFTKQTAKNIPYIKTQLDHDWNKENDVINTYDFDENGEKIDGSINIIIGVDMKGILFDEPYKIQTRLFKSHSWYEIIDIELTNIYDAIIHFNKLKYENNNLAAYVDNGISNNY